MTAAAPSLWILTASGRRFDVESPRARDVHAKDLAHALSNLCRFGGHTRVHYSVAQHSILVSELVPKELALVGLLHDAGEAYLGDVVGPVARRLPAFLALERGILAAVAARFGIRPEQFHDARVRHADRVALLTERRDLLPSSPIPWAEDLAGLRAAEAEVVPLTPRQAKAAFLARLDALLARGEPGPRAG